MTETGRERYHVERGVIEKVQDEPVGFRVIGDDYRRHHVLPVYAFGRKVYETWIERGQKMGRWTWEYL